jgi:hypothetical protein
MRADPDPKGNLFTAVENEAAVPSQSSYGASLDEENSGEPVLASGWWILPCAIGGLIECYFAVQWLISKL